MIASTNSRIIYGNILNDYKYESPCTYYHSRKGCRYGQQCYWIHFNFIVQQQHVIPISNQQQNHYFRQDGNQFFRQQQQQTLFPPNPTQPPIQYTINKQQMDEKENSPPPSITTEPTINKRMEITLENMENKLNKLELKINNIVKAVADNLGKINKITDNLKDINNKFINHPTTKQFTDQLTTFGLLNKALTNKIDNMYKSLTLLVSRETSEKKNDISAAHIDDINGTAVSDNFNSPSLVPTQKIKQSNRKKMKKKRKNGNKNKNKNKNNSQQKNSKKKPTHLNKPTNNPFNQQLRNSTQDFSTQHDLSTDTLLDSNESEDQDISTSEESLRTQYISMYGNNPQPNDQQQYQYTTPFEPEDPVSVFHDYLKEKKINYENMDQQQHINSFIDWILNQVLNKKDKNINKLLYNKFKFFPLYKGNHLITSIYCYLGDNNINYTDKF